jgi:hypothetical protein
MSNKVSNAGSTWLGLMQELRSLQYCATLQVYQNICISLPCIRVEEPLTFQSISGIFIMKSLGVSCLNCLTDLLERFQIKCWRRWIVMNLELTKIILVRTKFIIYLVCCVVALHSRNVVLETLFQWKTPLQFRTCFWTFCHARERIVFARNAHKNT